MKIGTIVFLPRDMFIDEPPMSENQLASVLHIVGDIKVRVLDPSDLATYIPEIERLTHYLSLVSYTETEILSIVEGIAASEVLITTDTAGQLGVFWKPDAKAPVIKENQAQYLKSRSH